MNCLELTNISKTINGKKILDNISFAVDEGQIVGLIGPNGAGKTTSIRIIADNLRPTNGEVSINGFNYKDNREKALSFLSSIIETPSLYDYLSGKENISFIRKIKGISDQKVQQIVEKMGLTDRINDSVRKYSLGMKQRLAIGMALISDPKLLVLDEPTNGLDPSGVIEFRRLLVDINKSQNITILISSHNLSEMRKICNRFIFIKKGKIVADRQNNCEKGLQKYKLTLSSIETAKLSFTMCSFVTISEAIDNIIFVLMKSNDINNLVKFMIENNIQCEKIEPISDDLYIEDEYKKIFMEDNPDERIDSI